MNRRKLELLNVTEFSTLQTLKAYKRQPVIEKRFSQLKTDFAVAPVYLSPSKTTDANSMGWTAHEKFAEIQIRKCGK